MKRSEVDINKLSPMMRQYIKIKEEVGDTLLFFRLGDFYELFFEDAHLAASILEIALTGKQCGLTERVPMCGVPHHAANVYIGKLVEAGHKVAICEQVEEAGASKGIVRREVVQVITGGTIMSNELLKSASNNYIGAVTSFGAGYNLVYADLSTGSLYSMILKHNDEELISKIMLYDIRELVINEDFDLALQNRLKNELGRIISIHQINNNNILKKLYKNVEDDRYLSALQLLLDYLVNISKREIDHLKPAVIINDQDFLKFDFATKRNLELVETLKMGTRENSLLAILDQTKTAMGSRMLKSWLLNPLTDIKLINDRYDLIDQLNREFMIKAELKQELTGVYDLERLIGRISYGNATPRDLLQLKQTLAKLPLIHDLLAKLKNFDLLKDVSDIYYLLERSIDDNATHNIKDGGFIKYGFNEELDELTTIRRDGKKYLVKFEAEERERTGIKNLKIGYNKIFGYYLEITNGSLHLLKKEWGYERKQTLSNAERFITPILKEKENLILRSEETIIKLERELLTEVLNTVKGYINDIQDNANTLAKIDTLISLAEVSSNYGYVRPKLITNREIEVVAGRHPIIEIVNRDLYVPNDIIVKPDDKVFIITGPNMSGKSTYMRQIAMMVIMAQMGSFVPAKSATLPIFDQIFTRIGASDDLVSGESTFMVEMLEANRALQNATINSLILFDELGRGTATYDGMSLAYAIIEYISQEVGAITYFSTHYHELTELAEKLDNVKNIHVQAEIVNQQLIFKHKIESGSVDKSYGIYVAKLANLPSSLIKRANELLNIYENIEINKTEQLSLPLFESNENEGIINDLKQIDVNKLTPVEALNFLDEIKNKIKQL